MQGATQFFGAGPTVASKNCGAGSQFCRVAPAHDVLRVARMAAAKLAALVVLGLGSAASARPITVGAGIGAIEADQDYDGETDDTLQVFGKVGLTARVAAQVELQKIESSQSDVITRTGTALLVVELGQSGRLVPTMFAGLGIDHAEDPYGGTQDGSHIEGGFGLEYRVDGGLVISADLRLGGRSVDNDDAVILDGGIRERYAPMLIEGEYRSARIGVGLRF
jgi:hypothetical protein